MTDGELRWLAPLGPRSAPFVSYARCADDHRACGSAQTDTPERADAQPVLGGELPYLPARRCQRVALSIFLCFFFRMRLRRFLMSDPML